MKTIIVAYDQKYGIGAQNDLLWRRDLPADLKRFKDLTSGNAVIMGMNTYLSIGRPLPNRQNIVISYDDKPIEGVQIARDLQSAYSLVDASRETFVIGGGKIYADAIDSVDQIMATEVNATFDQATVFFPAINTSKWREIERTKHVADGQNLYDYDFVTYERF